MALATQVLEAAGFLLMLKDWPSILMVLSG
jgi:hypothetical protein